MAYLAGGSDESALMPANLTTFAHFPVSSAINFPNSAVDTGAASEPSVQPSLQLGICQNRVHLLTIAAAVSFGATRPSQALTS
jgi:hypothetical protein